MMENHVSSNGEVSKHPSSIPPCTTLPPSSRTCRSNTPTPQRQSTPSASQYSPTSLRKSPTLSLSTPSLPPTTPSPKNPSPKNPSPPNPSPRNPSTPNPSTPNPSTPNPSPRNTSTPNPSPKNPSPKNPSTPNPSPKNPSLKNPSTPNPSPKNPSSPNPSPKNSSTPNPSPENPSTPNTSRRTPSPPNPGFLSLSPSRLSVNSIESHPCVKNLEYHLEKSGSDSEYSVKSLLVPETLPRRQSSPCGLKVEEPRIRRVSCGDSFVVNASVNNAACVSSVVDGSIAPSGGHRQNVAEILARTALPLMCTPPLAPLLVAQPPTPPEDTNDEDTRDRRLAPAAGQCEGLSGSGGGAKSAPPTPQGDRLQPPCGGSSATSSSSTPPPFLSNNPPQLQTPSYQASPSRTLNRRERSALKQLGISSPTMTAAPAAPVASAAGPAAATNVAGAAASAPMASSGTVSQSGSDGGSSPAILEENVVLQPVTLGGVGAMMPQLISLPPMAPVPLPLPSPGTSKARQKKFHRHFKSVDEDEKVINYYSCALVAEILLQGHLYITKNYFAFYSNVFGYVTKLLIPTVSVVHVSKEKTARIIPNAVGISTKSNKHVFGSLLSRDSTYKLMVQVWELANSNPAIPVLEVPPPKEVHNDAMEDSQSGDVLLAEDDDSSLSGSGPDCPAEPEILPEMQTESPSCPLVTECPITSCPTLGSSPFLVSSSDRTPESVSRPTVLLLLTTALLVLLFTFAGVLLYRIGQIQEQLGIHRDDLYPDLVRWQSKLHTRSASQVEQFLDTHLTQLAKVRQSLEALSLLIMDSEDAPGMMPPTLQENEKQEGVHRKENVRSQEDDSLKQWTSENSAQSSKNS